MDTMFNHMRIFKHWKKIEKSFSLRFSVDFFLSVFFTFALVENGFLWEIRTIAVFHSKWNEKRLCVNSQLNGKCLKFIFNSLSLLFLPSSHSHGPCYFFSLSFRAEVLFTHTHTSHEWMVKETAKNNFMWWQKDKETLKLTTLFYSHSAWNWKGCVS